MAGPGDELADWLDHKRAEAGAGENGIAIIHAYAGHHIAVEPYCWADEIGLRRVADGRCASTRRERVGLGRVEIEPFPIDAGKGKRRPNLADRIDELALPRHVRRRPRIIAADTAQQAIADCGARPVVGTNGIEIVGLIEFTLADRLIARGGGREAGEVEVDST